MADSHVISTLREKRAAVSGLIEKLERNLEQHRADLAHIDDVLRLFRPDQDPDEIKSKRPYVRRTRYFARNQFSRLIFDTLRKADGKPISGDEIINQVLAAKGFDTADAVMRAALRKQALTMLRAYRKRAAVEQTGLGRGVPWKLTENDLGSCYNDRG
jgi:hypothetical protein